MCRVFRVEKASFFCLKALFPLAKYAEIIDVAQNKQTTKKPNIFLMMIKIIMYSCVCYFSIGTHGPLEENIR